MLNSSIWLIDRTLSGATTSGQSEPENKGVFRIPQNSSITGASPSDCLASYLRHSLGECLSPLERCSQSILQLQLTELLIFCIQLYHVKYFNALKAEGRGDQAFSVMAMNDSWFMHGHPPQIIVTLCHVRVEILYMKSSYLIQIM